MTGVAISRVKTNIAQYSAQFVQRIRADSQLGCVL